MMPNTYVILFFLICVITVDSYFRATVKRCISCLTSGQTLYRYNPFYQQQVPTDAKLFSSSSSSSSSVSPEKKPSKPPVAFILSPSTQSGEQEVLIIQNFNQIQEGIKKKIGFIGTQDLTENHRQMIELLSYALILSGNHVYTSGGGNGTNIAVIRGALRACNTDLLTVILPQSLYKQPPEMQPLLMRVANLIQQPEYDDIDLKKAANICNEKILSNVDKVIVFAYHSSDTLLSSIEAYNEKLEVIRFYLD